MQPDDFWFRKNAPGVGVRTPGEAKSLDESDWAEPARDANFTNEIPQGLKDLLTSLESEETPARIYAERVVV